MCMCLAPYLQISYLPRFYRGGYAPNRKTTVMLMEAGCPYMFIPYSLYRVGALKMLLLRVLPASEERFLASA